MNLKGLHLLQSYLHPEKEMSFLNFNKKSNQKNSENEKIILMSDGSELVLIGKENFVRHSDLDTICKIEQIVSHMFFKQSLLFLLIRLI